MAEGEDAARPSMFQKAVVGVRLRPLSKRESDMCPKDDEDAVTFDEAAGVVNILDHRLPFHPELWLDECHFSEDRKQGAEGQLQLYDRLVTPIVEAAIRGRPGVVLAYGQNGTGKTYTIREPSGATVRAGSSAQQDSSQAEAQRTAWPAETERSTWQLSSVG